MRGCGSGHLERHNGLEAHEPLMIALAAERDDPEAFRCAFEMTNELLSDVSQRFQSFVRQSKVKMASQRQGDRHLHIGLH